MNFSAQGKAWIDFWHSKILSIIYICVGLPLVFGIAYLLLPNTQTYPSSIIQIEKAETWTEPLPGTARFTQEYFQQLSEQPADFTHADWKEVKLPSSIELGAKETLGENPALSRIWFKFKVTAPQTANLSNPWMLYGTRAMSGPYSLWVNGQQVFANLDDWRMLWNKPIFISIPPNAYKPGESTEIMFALSHRSKLGYALGSLSLGHQDDLKFSRDFRYLLQVGLPLVSLLMISVTGFFRSACGCKDGRMMPIFGCLCWLVLLLLAIFNSRTTSPLITKHHSGSVAWWIQLPLGCSYRFSYSCSVI